MIINSAMIDEWARTKHQISNNWKNHPEHGLIFDCSKFFENFTQYSYVDIMTFSCSSYGHSFFVFDQCKIRRLLIGSSSGFLNAKEKLGRIVRFVPNTHVKLYLLYHHRYGKIPTTAYLGSLNLCSPTLNELMIQIDNKEQLKCLVEYFNYIWKQGRLSL